MSSRAPLVLLALLTSCAHRAAPTNATARPVSALGSRVDYAAIVAAADRTPADRALDGGRKPAAFLAFLGVLPGWHVADLSAGGGYTTELLARAVGRTGSVYAQNAPSMLARIGRRSFDERLLRAADANVRALERELDDPFPPDTGPLDLIVINMSYHDAVWLKIDRAAMNKAVFAVLRSGGSYVVADSSAKAGSGDADAQTLHRIDEVLVKAEVLRAGFKLEATSAILRNSSDLRDWNTSPMAAGERRGSGDRFVLRFAKP